MSYGELPAEPVAASQPTTGKAARQNRPGTVALASAIASLVFGGVCVAIFVVSIPFQFFAGWAAVDTGCSPGVAACDTVDAFTTAIYATGALAALASLIALGFGLWAAIGNRNRPVGIAACVIAVVEWLVVGVWVILTVTHR